MDQTRALSYCSQCFSSFFPCLFQFLVLQETKTPHTEVCGRLDEFFEMLYYTSTYVEIACCVLLGECLNPSVSTQ